ncbi:protein FRG2-like-2 [Echinops telfairi]|uniref:Protein FRG2-like-2 n=1 Tax=Echinops telfairi TaxID=9371 RepID=A0ABM0J5T2_ECHTE|nr:protein FRG2-like-2 [Echinops telfairi]
MGMETEDPGSPGPSKKPAVEQTPHQPTSFMERGSGVEEKQLSKEDKILSSQAGGQCTQNRGGSPVTLREEKEQGSVTHKETQDEHLKKRSRAPPRHTKRPRSQCSEDQPPPLRKKLVTTVRSLCEAIYQDVAQVQAQQAQTPLTSQELTYLSQLRDSLYTTTQTLYTMSSQAAYLFPAQGWMDPTPQPPARDTDPHGR